VIVFDKELPIGLLANAAAVLGVSLGRLAVESVGTDVVGAAISSLTSSLPLVR